MDPMLFFFMLLMLFTIMSFAIPSTSGLATATMPLIAPLVATTFNQTVAVDAMSATVLLFSVAIGAVNMFIPTQAVVMAEAEQSRVGYARMAKVSFPYAMAMIAITGVILVPAFGVMLG
jgi:uncharacterized ion transporter superfamily protein YfcC